MLIKMKIKPNKLNYTGEGEIIGFGAPFNRTLTFGLDKMALEEVPSPSTSWQFLQIKSIHRAMYYFFRLFDWLIATFLIYMNSSLQICVGF